MNGGVEYITYYLYSERSRFSPLHRDSLRLVEPFLGISQPLQRISNFATIIPSHILISLFSINYANNSTLGFELLK